MISRGLFIAAALLASSGAGAQAMRFPSGGGGASFTGGAVASGIELDETYTLCTQPLALSWDTDENSGWQRSAADTLTMCINGATAATYVAGGTTFVGGVTISGAATDVTTGTNESVKIFANGTGDAHIAPGLGGNTVYLNQASTAYVDGVVSGSVTAFVGRAPLVIVSNGSDGAAATEVARIGDGNGYVSVFGTGVVKPTQAYAGAGDLATQAACAAADDVRKQVWYSDTGASKVSLCVCEQTGAGTFAWGAVTATGDCT